jgi:DNA-binding response OmpR family regulator
MRGWELTRLAREINPELPVVYMTSASADEWPANGVPNSILLQKPFAMAQLLTAVSQLLNKGTPPAS